MSADLPTPVTRDTPAWQCAAVAWKGVRGIHTPWIAEVSPMQLGAMNGRTRRAYDARRRAEWDASAEGHAAWRAEVMAAFDAGAFTLDHPELHREARDAVRSELVARAKRAAEEAEAARRRAVEDDHWTRETAKPGDPVWHILYRWMRVRRVNRETVTLAPLDGGRFAPKIAWRDALKHNPNDPADAPPPAAEEVRP